MSGWATAARVSRNARATIDDLESRLEHRTVFDDVTGLFNRQGITLVGGRLVNIARRDSDGVSACVVRILPAQGHVEVTDDDVIAVAEAAEVVFRSGDAVGRAAFDEILVIGKGPGFTPATVESRLVAQMAAMAPPDSPIPGVVVGVGVLQPWDEGALPELEQMLADDLAVRLAVRGVADRA